MPRKRFYGTICPICKRTIGIGVIELEGGAQLSHLRSELARKGWTGETAYCADPECNSSKLCEPKDLIFLDLQKISES